MDRNPYIGAKCTVARMLATLDDAELRNWTASKMDGLDSPQTSPADAAVFARQAGFPMSPAIVRRHRRRLVGRGEQCWCPTTDATEASIETPEVS